MAKLRYNLDITPAQFPITSTTQAGKTKFSQYDESETSGAIVPNWIENLWVLANNQLGQVASRPNAMDDLPATIQSRLLSESISSHQVVNGGSRSVCIVGESFIATWGHTGWHVHFAATSLQYPSVATLKGVSYLHSQERGLYRYTQGTEDFSTVTEVPLTGVDAKQFVSIVASISYLVATDGETIYWSAPLDNTYWQPNGVGAQTGAGSSKVLDIKHGINFLAPARDGFYIFTTSNCVYAAYTNNPANPWMFREVTNSSGIYKHNNIITDENSGGIIALADAGIIRIQQDQAEYALPEVMQLLESRNYESWDYVTNTIVREATILRAQIQLLNKRFVCVSYGKRGSAFSYILLFDLMLQRISRLRLDHVLVVPYDSSMINGVRYWDWEVPFEAEVRTYAELLGTTEKSEINSLILTVLLPNGSFTDVGFVDILDTADRTPLANCVHFSELQLTRNRDAELSTTTLYLMHDQPALLPAELPQVLVAGDYDTAQVSYVAEPQWGNQLEYTERVRGRKISITYLNVPSLQDLEVGVIATGVRRSRR